ncbi:hypothetical protein GCM10010975_13150 [Comamonas phosphati]|nr:hypothetical protein GCM10010975_13150 [Comamonas phosphati]
MQAVRSAETLALRLLQRTAHALQQPAPVIQDAAQLGIRADSQRSLLLHQGELLKGYPQALLETLAQSARQPFSFSSPAITGSADLAEPGPSVSPGGRQSWLDGQRLQQAVAPMVELALAELDALVSAAQGMAYVHPESNPLRPESYVRAWVQLIAATGVEPAHAQCWLKVMGQHLGPLLVSEYARTAKLLRELGVVPALYAPLAPQAQAAAQRRHGDHASQRARWQAPEQYGDAMAQSRAYAVQRESLLTLCLLQELLSDPRWIGDSRYTAPQTLTGSMLGSLAGADAAQPPFLRAIPGGGAGAEQRGHEGAQQGAPEGLGPGWSSSYSTTALESAQHHRAAPLQALGLSEQTLRRMMAHMAADAQLLPSVRQVVLSLEPALMQLLGRGERFFEDHLHPARQLLDELTARSLWFAGEDAPGFAPFIQAADSAARQLAAQPAVDAQLFAQVLQRLRDGWGMSALDQGAPADLQPPGQEDCRNTKAFFPGTAGPGAATQSAALPDSERIVQAMRRLPSARGVPEDILDFVTGPWAQVIAQAQERAAAGLPSSGSDPGGYLALVPSLLWSVSPRASADTRRLAGLAPRLQSRLAEGLKSVGRTEWEIRALAARLAGLHQDALDAGLALSAAPQSQPDALDLLPSTLASLDGVLETMPGPLADEGDGDDGGLAVAGVREVLTAALGRPAQKKRQPLDAGAGGRQVRFARDDHESRPEWEPAGAGPAEDAGNWPLGSWVELRNERQQLRTRLTWVSPQQSLFLFTAADGSTQSMTRRMRDKLVAKGQLRRVEDEGAD